MYSVDSGSILAYVLAVLVIFASRIEVCQVA